MLTEIPQVRRDNAGFGEIVYRAFRDIGFVFVYAPEVTEKLPRIFSKFKEVFGLPAEIKQKYNGEEVHYQRGWLPPDTEEAIACRHIGPGRTSVANAYEGWFMGPDLPPDHSMVLRSPKLNAPNIWPDEVPEFHLAMADLYMSLRPIGMEVLKAVAPRIGKDPDYFDEITRDGTTVMRALHYPAIKPEQVGKVMWGCRHTDICLLTMLPSGSRQGLYIKLKGKSVWISGMAPAGYVVAQVGDMFQHLTGGEFTSAWHEVRAPKEPTSEGRYSAAMFIHPRSDVVLGFDESESPDKAKRYPKRTADDLLQTRLNEIGLGEGKKKKSAY